MKKRAQKAVAIYSRRATNEIGTQQETLAENSELAVYAHSCGWLLYREYVDLGYSGPNKDPPRFRAMMRDVSKGKFDIVIVYRTNRLTRTIAQFLEVVDELGRRGIDFVSYKDGCDTVTPDGKSRVALMCCFQKPEREMCGVKAK